MNQIVGGIENLQPGPLDYLRGPYPDLAAACTAIPNVGIDGLNYRQGKMVDIGTGGSFITYWWKGGYGDGDLIPYIDLSAYATNSDLDSFSIGIDNAIATTVPATNIRAYNASAVGTYTNFGGLAITLSDLNSGLVQLRNIGGTWTKVIIPVLVNNGPVNLSWYGALTTNTPLQNDTAIASAFATFANIGTFLIPKGVQTTDALEYPVTVTVYDYERNLTITNRVQVGGVKTTGVGATIQMLRGYKSSNRVSFYVVPNGIPSGSVPAAVKIFFDDFEAEQEKAALIPGYTPQYRDIGIYPDKSLGTTGAGMAVWNTKGQSNWFGVYPESGLAIQDGNVIPLRIVYHDYTIPHLKVTDAWNAGVTVNVNDIYVAFPGIYYKATVAGVTGSTAPTHTSGTASDGTVTWLFVQKAKTGGAGFQGVVVIGDKTAAPVKYIQDLALQIENHMSLKNGKAFHFLKNDNTSNGYFEAALNTSDVYYRFPNPVGAIATLGTITPGTLYTNGSYTNVPLTGGTGIGATANITVAGNVVTVVTPVLKGVGYTVADTLSASAANMGGTGSGFSVPIATLATVLSPAPGIRYASAGYQQFVNAALATNSISKASLATTQSVANGNVVAFGDASATNFTGFTNGITGQTVYCSFSNGQTTLVTGANFILCGGLNHTPNTNDVLAFYSSNGTIFREIGNRQVVIIDATATPYTKTTINAAYSTATKGVKIICDVAGFTYVKKDNTVNGNWTKYISSQLT